MYKDNIMITEFQYMSMNLFPHMGCHHFSARLEKYTNLDDYPKKAILSKILELILELNSMHTHELQSIYIYERSPNGLKSAKLNELGMNLVELLERRNRRGWAWRFLIGFWGEVKRWVWVCNWKWSARYNHARVSVTVRKIHTKFYP